MRIAYTHLCDSAVTAADGKVSMFGLFSSVTASALPVTFVPSALVFGVEMGPEDPLVEIDIQIACTAPTGEVLFTMSAKVGARPVAEWLMPRVLPIAVTLPPIRLDRVGVYRVSVGFASAGMDEAASQFQVFVKQQASPEHAGA